MSEMTEEIFSNAMNTDISDRAAVEDIHKALLSLQEETIKRCAERCDVDWSSGMPATAIEYAAAKVLKERILSLLGKAPLDGKKITKEKLKAFFASQFFKYADTYGPDYSELTGGDLIGFSLEALGNVIDAFDEDVIR